VLQLLTAANGTKPTTSALQRFRLLSEAWLTSRGIAATTPAG
jgi:hypothetical protein